MDAKKFLREKYKMLELFLNKGNKKNPVDAKVLDKFANEIMIAINNFLKNSDPKVNTQKKLFEKIKKIAIKYAPSTPKYKKDYNNADNTLGNRIISIIFNSDVENFENINKVCPSNVELFAGILIKNMQESFRVFYTDAEKEEIRADQLKYFKKLYLYDPTNILYYANGRIQGNILVNLGFDSETVEFWFGKPFTNAEMAKLNGPEKEQANTLAEFYASGFDNSMKNKLPDPLRLIPVRQSSTRVEPRVKPRKRKMQRR